MDKQKLQKIEKLGTFILGGVAGAAAGILLAPRSGRETRGAMSSRAGEARQSGSEDYFEARERIRERLAGMRGPRRMDEDTAEIPLGPLDDPPTEDMTAPEPEEHPGLWAVPPEEESESPAEPEQSFGGDPEELRRRIRDTRNRLGRREESGEE